MLTHLKPALSKPDSPPRGLPGRPTPFADRAKAKQSETYGPLSTVHRLHVVRGERIRVSCAVKPFLARGPLKAKKCPLGGSVRRFGIASLVRSFRRFRFVCRHCPTGLCFPSCVLRNMMLYRVRKNTSGAFYLPDTML